MTKKSQGKGGEHAHKAQEKISENSEKAQEVAGQVRERGGQFAEEGKQKAKEMQERLTEQAGQVKNRAGEMWEGEQGQKVRETARSAKDKVVHAAQETQVQGKEFYKEITEEGEGEGIGGEAGRKAKEGAHVAGQFITGGEDGESGLPQMAGQFLGAMRAQGGGIGQETESMGKGVEQIRSTAVQAWEQIPEGAKETVVAGGKRTAEVTERLFNKVAVLLEKALDFADKKLFVEDDDDEVDEEKGQASGGQGGEGVVGGVGGGGIMAPLLSKPAAELKKLQKEKEKAKKEKEKVKKKGAAKVVAQVVGGVVMLLLLTMMLFFLGFFLLPVLLIALLLMLIGFQCYACCGV